MSIVRIVKNCWETESQTNTSIYLISGLVAQIYVNSCEEKMWTEYQPPAPTKIMLRRHAVDWSSTTQCHMVIVISTARNTCNLHPSGSSWSPNDRRALVCTAGWLTASSRKDIRPHDMSGNFLWLKATNWKLQKAWNNFSTPSCLHTLCLECSNKNRDNHKSFLFKETAIPVYLGFVLPARKNTECKLKPLRNWSPGL